MMFGADGIFTKSQYATEKYKSAQNEEEEQIAKISNEIDSYVNGNRGYTPISYSLKEQDTGLKWIDGSPIYQITKQYKDIEGVVSGSRKEFALENAEYINNIDTLISAEGVITNYADMLLFSSSMHGQLTMYNGTSITKNEVWIDFSTQWNNVPNKLDVVVTYRYTKK